MKLILLIIIVILIGIIVYLFTKTKTRRRVKMIYTRPMWWGPVGKKPPSPPVRWGYRQLCRKRLNC